VFDAELDRIGLHQLAQVNERGEIACRPELILQIHLHAIVAMDEPFVIL